MTDDEAVDEHLAAQDDAPGPSHFLSGLIGYVVLIGVIAWLAMGGAR